MSRCDAPTRSEAIAGVTAHPEVADPSAATTADALAVPEADRRPSIAADYAALAKPRIAVMVVITAWIGFAFGATSPGQSASGLSSLLSLLGLFGSVALWSTLIGTALACMGSAVINQAIERDTDALMHRTRTRPLPAGRIGLRDATIFGLALLAVGHAVLWWGTNPAATAACAFTAATYLGAYTLLKPVHWTSTHIGAVPGAMPPVIGYLAAAGTWGVEAAVLFAIMLIWQVPHFLAIAWLYREDYARAGLPMLPVIDDDLGSRTFPQVVLGCALLLPIGLMPTLLGFSGWAYFAVAMFAGLVFVSLGAQLVIHKTRRDARTLFLASLIYLPAVLGMMVVDRL